MSLWREEVIMKACPQMRRIFSVSRTCESYFELIFSPGATHRLSLCKAGARLKKWRLKGWRLDTTSSSAIATQQVQLTYLPVILLRSEQGFARQHVLVFVLPAAVSGARPGRPQGIQMIVTQHCCGPSLQPHRDLTVCTRSSLLFETRFFLSTGAIISLAAWNQCPCWTTSQ